MTNDIRINGCVYVVKENQRYINLKEFGTCLRYYVDIPSNVISQESLQCLDNLVINEMTSGGVSCVIIYPLNLLNIYNQFVNIEIFPNQNISFKIRARISCISIQENEDSCFPYECSGAH